MASGVVTEATSPLHLSCFPPLPLALTTFEPELATPSAPAPCATDASPNADGNASRDDNSGPGPSAAPPDELPALPPANVPQLPTPADAVPDPEDGGAVAEEVP